MVISAIGIARVHSISPVNLNQVSFNTAEVVELDGIRTKLTIQLRATPHDICDASMHVELNDGVESTRVYSAGLFNEMTFLNTGWAVKEVILPSFSPPGKARMQVLGEFRCNWFQQVTPFVVPLGSGVIKIADAKRWSTSPEVKDLRNKIQSLTVYLEHLRDRVEALERRNN
jgi:hypothetical protein